MVLQDGKYYIDGLDALSLCEQFGVPLYVYDFAKMEEQYNRLTTAFATTRFKPMYACKALSNLSILKFFKYIGAGLDTVSIQEVWLGLKAGFAPQDIMYTPNCVSFEEIEMAVKAGVKVNIDNVSILEQFGEKYHDTYPICIRLNPHISAGGNAKISVGHIDSKFGISIYQMRHVERLLATTGVKVEGIHMHTGSDIMNIEVFINVADILFELATDYFPDLQYIDFGSGFKVPYKSGDKFTDVALLGEKLSARFNEFCKEYGRDLTLLAEPGKFLVSEAGYFFVKTNVIKQTTATVFAGVDSGMNHLIRPMFYDSYHHIVNVTNPVGKTRFYTVVGYICETDTFAIDRKIHEILEDDILCFKNAGAYAFSMASNYNSRFRPAEVAVYQGKAHLIRQRETLDDLLRNQVEIHFDTTPIPAITTEE